VLDIGQNRISRAGVIFIFTLFVSFLSRLIQLLETLSPNNHSDNITPLRLNGVKLIPQVALALLTEMNPWCVVIM
jgi:hypothetical protein